ncbi:MAG: VOC family protein [Candidatus Entotheonellia bacterium]
MEASAISHIAICTRDMEKSLAFYRDILGLKVLYGTPASATSQPSVEKEIINLACGCVVPESDAAAVRVGPHQRSRRR